MAEKKKSDGKKQVQLDKRVVDRLLQAGSLPREEFETYLRTLPDLADHADNISDKVYQDH